MSQVNSEQKTISYSSWELIKDILEMLRPYRVRFWLASLVRLMGDVAWLYNAVAFASVVDFLKDYKEGESFYKLWVVIILWLTVTIVRALTQFVSKKNGYLLAEKLAIDSTLKAIKHLLSLDMEWHERENSGNKIKRIQNASEGFNKILRLWFNNIIEITVNLIVINIIIAQFDRIILFVLLLFLFIYFFISHKMGLRAGKAHYLVNTQEEVVSGLLFETINNIRTVKVMSMVKNIYTILIQGTEKLFEKIGARTFWYQSRSAYLALLTGVFRIGINLLIIKGILNHQYEIGFMVMFNMYFYSLHASIDELSNTSIELATSKQSIGRMKKILNEPITIDDDEGKINFSPDWQKIRIQDLEFSYGKNKVLSNISFEIKRGEKVGIVGLSGAGKSTLFKLLLKEREDFRGDILFDDVSIKKIRKDDYFNYASVVLQDTEVFNFSLKDNITITNTAQAENKKLLKQSLTIAHISELVSKLPQGLDTLIGEKGVKLSGGERQRLGIARAIFKQPQILLLDEATSHLDLESEEKIRDSLHKFFENVTAIVIAHRLTTIREMDKILVIENGQIVEAGSFESLYSKKGRFFELWEKQGL
jgi:ABC-type multidrug transport system fused ATPase/permease subunit